MMKNHFDCGYEFVTETGEKRYIAFVDYDYGVPHYDTYPIEVREQLDANSELLFDYDFVDKHRICMDEHELYELRIKELEKQLAAGKISVETPLGTLTACIGGEPKEYPEIFTYITRHDGVEMDLVAVEIKKDARKARAYLYSDTSTDAYTDTYDWSEMALNINVEGIEIKDRCKIPTNQYPDRFLGKLAPATDCMRDAYYWTYPAAMYEVIQAKPELMDDADFNAKYACRLTAAQWLNCRVEVE